MIFKLLVIIIIAWLLASCDTASLTPTTPSESRSVMAQPTPAIAETGAAPTATLSPRPQPTAMPSPTPTVCLDKATPIALPPRKTPLELRFMSDGNIWLWQETERVARQIMNTGDARSMAFADDGLVIAFVRVHFDHDQSHIYERDELWVVNRDGSGLSRLVSEDDVGAMASPPRSQTNQLAISRWITGTHTLIFSVNPVPDGIGDLESYGLWSVDADTLTITRLPPMKPTAPGGIVSPDRRRMAIMANHAIGLANVDGTNRRDNLVTFPHIGLGHYSYEPSVIWSRDSKFVRTIIPSADPFAAAATFTTWLIPADGSPAQQMATFVGFGLGVRLSPNQQYIAFWKRLGDQSNHRELHLAKFDGSNEVVYDMAYSLVFIHWAPDWLHFVYRHHLTSNDPTLLGDICGAAAPLTDVPTDHIEWVDSHRFLFVTVEKKSSIAAEPFRELRLGSIGEPSILIGELKGDRRYTGYSFNRENAAIGQGQ